MGLSKRRLRSAGALASAGALIGTAAFGALAPTSAQASPVLRQANVANTDWTSGGVSGVGSSDVGTISLSGITGPVTNAWLVWNGIGSSGPYTNPTVSINGQPVTGTNQGESGSNCWGGDVTSRTYAANVKLYITGDGPYTISGLSQGGNSNGANLIVTYKDGNDTNNRDLYIYFGNDSNAGLVDGYPGEDNAWNDTFSNLNYIGGDAAVQLAVSDGQDFGENDDGLTTFTGDAGTVTYDDSITPLWDGNTLPDMGSSRASNGGLYDLRTFDVTGAFESPGITSLTLGHDLTNDCLAVTTAVVDLAASGSQPPPVTTVSVNPASRTEGTAPLPNGAKFTKMVFRVSLNHSTSSDVNVTLQTVDGTANAPTDYKTRTQTITIPAGERTATFKVSVVPDSSCEGTEYFYAQITAADVGMAQNSATGTIFDDDCSSTAMLHASKAQYGGIR